MLLSFLFAYFGFAALSLSKNRHYQQVWPHKKLVDSTEKILTTLGWILLAFSSLYIFQSAKVSIAITEFLGILTIAALVLILQFSYFPHTVAGVALVDAGKRIAQRIAVASK